MVVLTSKLLFNYFVIHIVYLVIIGEAFNCLYLLPLKRKQFIVAYFKILLYLCFFYWILLFINNNYNIIVKNTIDNNGLAIHYCKERGTSDGWGAYSARKNYIYSYILYIRLR